MTQDHPPLLSQQALLDSDGGEGMKEEKARPSTPQVSACFSLSKVCSKQATQVQFHFFSLTLMAVDQLNRVYIL